MLSWGQGLQQTWNLTNTMTATLDISNGILTIKTTQNGEAQQIPLNVQGVYITMTENQTVKVFVE